MKANTKSNLSSLLIFAFVLISAGTASARSTDSKACVSCHQNMITDSMARVSIHQPFLNGECMLCHGDNDDTAASPSRSFGKKGNSVQQIKWLDQNQAEASVQWFRVPAAEVKNALYITTSDRKTTNFRLDIPATKTFAVIDNNKTPPAIKDVQVINIEKGVFISATISWRTDKIADSLVTFNSGGRNTKSYDSQLTTNHEVSLVGLKADQSYMYTVTSMDVFGNIAQSKSFTFSTSAAKQAKRSILPVRTGDNAKITGEIFTAGSDLVVKVSTDRPAALAIGTDMHAAPKKISSNTVDTASTVHGKMRVNINKTVALCVSCHKDHSGVRSHPVNVSPKRGMVIPADFPTSDDGKITCLTCHKAHASNLRYMLRKSQDRELCIGCHRDKDTGRAKGLLVNLTGRNPKNS